MPIIIWKQVRKCYSDFTKQCLGTDLPVCEGHNSAHLGSGVWPQVPVRDQLCFRGGAVNCGSV